MVVQFRENQSEQEIDLHETITVVTPMRRLLIDFYSNKVAVLSLIVFILVILLAIFAPWVSPQDPYNLAKLDLMDGRLPPGSIGGLGMVHWFGTDEQGRDILSAIFYGLRTSLSVGVISGIIALFLGTAVGLAAAYFGGRIDSICMRIVDFQLSFPAILLALILIAVLGQGVGKIITALVAIQWAFFARTVRSTALVEQSKEYMEAAQNLALGNVRILYGHLLPNCLPAIIVLGTVQVANAISLEATLSFLGLGLPVTEPSLGLLIANGFEYMLSGRYWLSFFPGVALLITVGSINLVGDHLREILNPRSER